MATHLHYAKPFQGKRHDGRFSALYSSRLQFGVSFSESPHRIFFVYM